MLDSINTLVGLHVQDRARTYQRLRAYQDQLAALQKLARIGCWKWNAKTDVVRGSAEMHRLFGFDGFREKVPNFGKQRGLCFPVADWERLNDAMQASLRTRKGFELELSACRGQETLWIRLRCDIMKDSYGNVSGLHGTVQDLTEQRRAEQTLALLKEHYQALSESIAEGLCIIELLENDSHDDIDFRFVGVNPAFTRYTGIEEAAGKRVWQVFPDYPPHWFAIYREVAVTGRARRFKNVSAFGQKNLDLLVFRPGASPKTIGVLLKDAVLAGASENPAAENRPMLAAAFAEASDGIFIESYDKNRIFCNQAFADFYRFKAPDECVEKLLTHSWLLDITDDAGDPAALDEWGFPIIQEGAAAPSEYWLRRKDTGESWAGSYRFTPLHDHDGAVIGRMITVRDVTAPKHALTLLTAANDRLTRTNRQTLEFLAIVSHELRNHLTPIMTVLPLIREQRPDGDRRAWACELLGNNAAVILRLMNDLLDACRGAANEEALKLEPVELAQALANALEAAADLINAKRQICRCRLPEHTLLIRGDFVRLTQIFTNLLINAAKYTPEGGRIEILIGEDGGRVHITVRDNGIGIAPTLMPHIFDPFFRGCGGVKGLGIGLTLVKKLVEQHHGSVSAVSAGINQGAEFTVSLPVAG